MYVYKSTMLVKTLLYKGVCSRQGSKRKPNTTSAYQQATQVNRIDEAIWADYDNSNQIEAKLRLIQQWIPQDVSTIIDIGCGNGKISNSLAEDYDVLGVDISSAALQYVQAKKLQASAVSIPLADSSFDLVLSSEMIEHLTDADLRLAINEMKRLSKRYILISVPNMEQLPNVQVKCDKCSRIYHAYGHLQSFTKSRLDELFEEFNCIEDICFGPLERVYHPLLLTIRNKVAGQYFHPDFPVSCPQCGGTGFVWRSNLLSKTCNLLNSRISKPKPYWLMMLFKKK